MRIDIIETGGKFRWVLKSINGKTMGTCAHDYTVKRKLAAGLVGLVANMKRVTVTDYTNGIRPARVSLASLKMMAR